MSPAIKFATLENIEIKITSEDADLIAFESRSFALILSGQLQEVVFDEPKYGGEAINLALKYCKEYGEIKHNCSQCPESYNINCKEEKHWVDGFISQITEAGLGMVHELVAVLYRLDASRLFDLTCQYIADDLSFNDYGKFREAFGFQFLFPPYFRYTSEIRDWEEMLDGLECPTLEQTLNEFRDKIPFTPSELKLAELENKSVRVGGNLKYETKNILIEEVLIKIEYIERRLNSFEIFSDWMDSTLSKCLIEYKAHLTKFFDDQANNDIGEVCSTIGKHATPFDVDIMHDLLEGIVDPCAKFEVLQNIDVIGNKMDKNELIFALEANIHKKKVEELAERCLKNWKSSHEDKIYPWLTYFLENCYQEIRIAFCALRGWTSPNEVLEKISKLNNWKTANFEYIEDENEYQDKDVESEAEVQAFVSSLRKFKYLAIVTAYKVCEEYHQTFRALQVAMRKKLHLDLLIKDEEILAYICKRKFDFYMGAADGGTRSPISFAEEEKEFDRIMEETDEKFGDRGPAVEEAKKKYRLHYKKYHYAMVDETKRQIKLLLDVEKGSLETEKESMEVEKECLQVEEGRRKRMRTAVATTTRESRSDISC